MSSGILHRPLKSGKRRERRERTRTRENAGSAENARERARTRENAGSAENARERRERSGTPRTLGNAEKQPGVPRTPGQEAGIKTETLLYFILQHYIDTL